MRTLSAQEVKLFANADGYAVAARVQVRNAAGTFVDLSTLQGYDWVKAVSYQQNVDDQAATATVTLFRERFKLSLSSLVGASRLNNGGALLAPAREMKIETATIPKGGSPSVWNVVFQGYIDSVDFAGYDMVLNCRDLGALLQNTWIRSERQYGSSGGVAVETVMQLILNDNTGGDLFVGSHVYALTDKVQAAVSGTIYGFRCTTAGTSAAGAPSWNATTGGTTTSGGAVFTCTGPVVVMSTPVSPLFLIRTYNQQKQSVMDALKALADCLGWSLQYRWDSGSSAFVLTFFEPGRAKTLADFTLSPSQYLEVKAANQSAENIRNLIQVVYSDPADLDNTGMPKRKTYRSADMTSIAAYGERFMEISEDATSQIDTLAEATTLGDNVKSDLSQPVLDHELELQYFYPVELGDLVGLTANGIHYDSDQKLGVVSIGHELSADKQRTTLGLRGKPSSGFHVWLEKESRPGQADGAAFTGPAAAASVAISSIVGGAAVSFAPPSENYDTAELHLSTTSGFTPSAATLKQTISGAQRFEVSDLNPGTTYYAKVICRDSLGNTSTPSSQVSFVPGYLNPSALLPTIDFSSLIKNGDFEVQVDATKPADCWNMQTGTWGTDAAGTSSSFTGGRAIRFLTLNAAIESDLVAIYPDLAYSVLWRSNTSALGSGGVQAQATWYSAVGAFISATALSGGTATVTGSWQMLNERVVPPAGAKYMAVKIVCNAVGTGSYVDSVLVTPYALPQQPQVFVGVGSGPAFQNSWVNNGGSDRLTHYYLDATGHVCIQGNVKSGTIGATVFTLPAGYRPVGNLKFPAYSFNGTSLVLANIEVTSAGAVNAVRGSNTEFGLNIRFKAEQ